MFRMSTVTPFTLQICSPTLFQGHHHCPLHPGFYPAFTSRVRDEGWPPRLHRPRAPGIQSGVSPPLHLRTPYSLLSPVEMNPLAELQCDAHCHPDTTPFLPLALIHAALMLRISPNPRHHSSSDLAQETLRGSPFLSFPTVPYFLSHLSLNN